MDLLFLSLRASCSMSFVLFHFLRFTLRSYQEWIRTFPLWFLWWRKKSLPSLAFTDTSLPSQPQPPPAMKLNIAYPSTGNQKFIEIDDEKKL